MMCMMLPREGRGGNKEKLSKVPVDGVYNAIDPFTKGKQE